MSKETLIALEIPQGSQLFPIGEADELLRMPVNGGWKLPEDSDWQWSADKGFERKKKEK